MGCKKGTVTRWCLQINQVCFSKTVFFLGRAKHKLRRLKKSSYDAAKPL